MPLISYLLLFFSIIVSGSAVFLVKKVEKRPLKLLLSFSGAYLFALTVLHLIPEVYKSQHENTGLYILIGFFIQIILEVFSQGIEHGHIHIHKNQNAAFPYGVMIGLCLHSFLEGMPLVQTFSDSSVQRSLLAGIIFHHIPVAIALMTMLIQSGLSKGSAFFYLMLFALMAPLGAVAGNLLNISDMPSVFNKVMAVVIGIFLHISTTILFESSEEHRFNYYKLAIILLGAGIAILS